MERSKSPMPFVFVAALFALWYGTAVAAPTPMPGGANQLKGLQGTLQSTMFNGKMRVRKMQLRLSTPDEQSSSAGVTAMTFVYLAANGTTTDRHGAFGADMVDADGVAISGRPTSVYASYYSLIPGAVARGTIGFQIPSGFTPVKIVLRDAYDSDPVFRINLKPSDLPSAPTPAPTASP
jgi:hypothetical protein